MPYFTFSTLTEKEYGTITKKEYDSKVTLQLSRITEAKAYQNLFEAYRDKESIIHGSRTLDEFFYHSLSDTGAQRDLEIRNKDQVTTKRIQHVIKHVGGHGEWTIIRIDQLWLWIVDDSKHSGLVLDSTLC